MPDSAIRSELVYGVDDRLQRAKKTGFAEQMTGFTTSETTFDPEGKPAAIVHKRSDGGRVDVRMIVSEVFQDVQEKAGELHPGDALLAVNEKPLSSVLDLMHGKPFAGGCIEVDRAGQRLRIDGFKPGRIGVKIYDKAAGMIR